MLYGLSWSGVDPTTLRFIVYTRGCINEDILEQGAVLALIDNEPVGSKTEVEFNTPGRLTYFCGSEEINGGGWTMDM